MSSEPNVYALHPLDLMALEKLVPLRRFKSFSIVTALEVSPCDVSAGQK